MDKITSYSILNYLLPGAIFVFLLKPLTGINLIQSDLLTGSFLYFFIGMVISRCGSLFLEPYLKGINFVRFESYDALIAASKIDAKIDVFAEMTNSYRTIITMLLILLLVKIYVFIFPDIKINADYLWVLTLIGILLIFLYSYKKQINYISSRIHNRTLVKQDSEKLDKNN